MDNKKFTLVDSTPEDQKAFAEGIEELLTRHSLSLSLIINKKAIAINGEGDKPESAFVDQPMLVLNKKVFSEETPIIKEAEIVSPLSEELTGNEPAQAA